MEEIQNNLFNKRNKIKSFQVVELLGVNIDYELTLLIISHKSV